MCYTQQIHGGNCGCNSGFQGRGGRSNRGWGCNTSRGGNVNLTSVTLKATW